MENLPTLEERVARIEGKLGWRESIASDEIDRYQVVIAYVCGVGAALCLYFAFGIPNHFYQYVFGGIFALLFALQNSNYKRAIVPFLVLLLIHLACLTFISRLFLGAGVVQPFSWAKSPSIQSQKESTSWNPISGAALSWEKTAVSNYEIDLTKVQSFLLLTTAIAGFFAFQPFASLVAFTLLLVSIPTLTYSNWDLVLGGIILYSIWFYLIRRNS